MKLFKNTVVVVALVLGVSLAPQAGEAAEHDLRTGVFQGNWCGFSARFEITSKRGSSWVFDGKIYLHDTGQYDKITVTQYANNSLRITRYLSGAHAGKTQYVVTHAPETLVSSGRTYVNFPVRTAGGYGAKVAGFLRMLR